jgi:hypothetical protein
MARLRMPPLTKSDDNSRRRFPGIRGMYMPTWMPSSGRRAAIRVHAAPLFLRSSAIAALLFTGLADDGETVLESDNCRVLRQNF